MGDTITITVLDAPSSASSARFSNAAVNEMTVVNPSVKVFPSPAKDMINLQYQDNFNGPASAIIYDMSGKVVAQMNFTKDQSVFQRSLNISNFQPGIYHVAVTGKDKKLVASFVKQ